MWSGARSVCGKTGMITTAPCLGSNKSFFDYIGIEITFITCRGATVHLVCRSKERGEKAVEEIKAKTGNSNVSLEVT